LEKDKNSCDSKHKLQEKENVKIKEALAELEVKERLIMSKK